VDFINVGHFKRCMRMRKKREDVIFIILGAALQIEITDQTKMLNYGHANMFQEGGKAPISSKSI
jgi:hypothetical protein